MKVVGTALAAGLTILVTGAFPQGQAQAAAVFGPVNPVRVDLAGHPANTGFLTFVEGNVLVNADESEGTMALGGNLSFGTSYNIAAGALPVHPTFTAAGDARPTYLYVGGGMDWAGSGSSIARVQNGGFSKIGDTSTYTAHNTDSNGALSNYRINEPGAAYEASPHVEGTTDQQTPGSIATPVPTSVIDIPGAFALYRQLTVQMAACPANAVLTNPDTGAPLPEPVPAGARGRLTLTQSKTNVLNLSTADLGNLAEINFADAPNAMTPLVVNVIGSSFTGEMPNMPGAANSPNYMLWNFPTAGAIDVLGGDSLEGTIYAPNAALKWQPTQNVEGNIIARSFIHGPSVKGQTRELHDFPFDTTVACDAAAPTATLTLVKHVDNAGGGTATPGDWTLTATGPSTITGPGDSDSVTDATVDAGDYQLSESGGPPDYEAGTWSCTGATSSDASVSLEEGDDVTCQITNTYVPPTTTATTTTTAITETTETTETTGTTDVTQITGTATETATSVPTTGSTPVTSTPVTSTISTSRSANTSTTRSSADASATDTSTDNTVGPGGTSSAASVQGGGSVAGGSTDQGITAADIASSGADLANTGAAPAAQLTVGIGLAALGVTFAFVGRRRQRGERP